MSVLNRKMIFRVLLRVFVFFIFVELLLRLGGVIFLTVQGHQNRINLGSHGEYRILCLGESSTALGGQDAYPNQLEEFLNLGQSRVNFKVVNKGIPSITTTHIALHLEEYLEEYKPQIVVTMIGINDSVTISKSANKIITEWERFFEYFNIYKLVKSSWLRFVAPPEEIEKESRLNSQLKKIEDQVNRFPTSENLLELAGLYRATNKFENEKETLLKVVAMNPQDYEAWGYLGLHYKRLGDYEKAVPALAKMVELSPPVGDAKVGAYAQLADCYRLWQKPKESERVYLESIQYLPHHPGAYGCLANLYLEEKRYEEAESLYEKQFSINPHAVLFYGKLAHCYRRNGRYLAAERLLKQAIQFNPKEAVLYVELGSCLLDNKKYKEAEEVLKRAIELKPKDEEGLQLDLNKYLLASYEAQGKLVEAKKLKQELTAQQEYFNPQTVENYQKIKDILVRGKVLFVVVQYPLQDITPLKKILSSSPDVFFVDNQKIFEEAIRESSYDDYFTDRFAGDFGHCTAKGNRLLAGNIAKVIEEKIFHPSLPDKQGWVAKKEGSNNDR